MTRRKFVFKFDPSLVKEPVTYHLVKDHDLVANILKASIDDKGGRLVIEIIGRPSQIQAGIDDARTRGARVRELVECVEKDESRCTHCGMCVSICPAEAFIVDRETWLVTFDSDKCIACGMCIDACPPGAMRLSSLE